jgi:hypothetical protein
MMWFQARQMGLMWMSGNSKLSVSWCHGTASSSLPEYALLLTGISYIVSYPGGKITKVESLHARPNVRMPHYDSTPKAPARSLLPMKHLHRAAVSKVSYPNVSYRISLDLCKMQEMWEAYAMIT